MSSRLLGTLASAALVGLSLSARAEAQTFDSGSDGSDGALTFGPSLGTVYFDPTTMVPPRDVDGDNVYHFTTITIGAGTTVVLNTLRFPEGVPVIWLASGTVLIAGVVDLSGGVPGTFSNEPAFAGAGGYRGGHGATPGAPQAGNGPGGGGAGGGSAPGGGVAGHLVAGPNASIRAAGGQAYGNDFLQPLLGGSGGGGGPSFVLGYGTAGGAGGGALLIASSASIRVDGAIRANGGQGSQPYFFTSATDNPGAGGGSGGAIRLIAPRLEGNGSLEVNGGASTGQSAGATASPGRIRLESFRHLATYTIPSGNFTQAPPGSVFPPASSPVVKAVRVNGVSVASSPTGSFDVPDVVIDAAGAVTVELEARNIPAGTVLNLTFQPATGTPFTATSTPLVAGAAGAPSTATASVSFPSGYTRVFIQANWTP